MKIDPETGFGPAHTLSVAGAGAFAALFGGRRADQPVTQPVIRAEMTIAQRQAVPVLAPFSAPRFAPPEVVRGFRSYREAVLWCWANRADTGAGDSADQALCASRIGLHRPHMSRCVNGGSSAPMNLCPDYLPAFEAFCGWRAATQFLAGQAQLTLLEQLLAERAAA